MFGGFKRYRAVLNAMNAKITFESLDASMREKMQIGSHALYASGGKTDDPDLVDEAALSRARDAFGRFSEFERYTLYSMAFEQALLSPVLSGETWDPPNNPFVIRLKPRDVGAAEEYFRKNHNLPVTLDLDR